MKLRNKKTGEAGYLIVGKGSNNYLVTNGNWHNCVEYNSLAELNEEWEDYEELKDYWCIDWTGGVNHIIVLDDIIHDKYKINKKEIGNYFETKKEAEKAVKKLKAWERLKKKGFKFDGWKRDERYYGDFTITATDQISCDDKDLNLLFGGEE